MKPTPLEWLIFAAGFAGATTLAWVAFPAILYRSVEQPLDFDHAAHSDPKLDLACATCHPFEEDGRFGGIPSIEVCAGCHDEYRAADPSLTYWHPYARLPDNAWFPHARHVLLASLPCERCHDARPSTSPLPEIEINRITGYSRAIWGTDISGLSDSISLKMTACEDCHDASGATAACQDCHR